MIDGFESLVVNTSMVYLVIVQRKWMTERINSESATSDLWRTVGLIYSQFEGLEMGYSAFAPPSQV